MSPIEVQKPKQLDVLAQMAGKEHKLPAADLPDINLVIGTGTVAMVAAGALLAPGSLGNPAEVRAADGEYTGNFTFNAVCVKPGQAKAIFNISVVDRDNLVLGGSRWGVRVDVPGTNFPYIFHQGGTGAIFSGPTALSSANPYYDGTAPSHTGQAEVFAEVPEGPVTITAQMFRNQNSAEDTDGDGMYYQEQTFALNCSTGSGNPDPGTPPVEPEPTPTSPPAPTPVSVLKPGLTLTTAKILPKNGKGKLSIATSVSQDSTCSINGAGNGADKNIKNRRKAARIELKLQNATTVGKLPNGMIALKNNKPVKKGQNTNMVSIDLRNAGIDPGERQASRFNYKLLSRAGKITAKVIIPASMSDCGARNMTSSLQLKSR